MIALILLVTPPLAAWMTAHHPESYSSNIEDGMWFPFKLAACLGCEPQVISLLLVWVTATSIQSRPGPSKRWWTALHLTGFREKNIRHILTDGPRSSTAQPRGGSDGVGDPGPLGGERNTMEQEHC